MRYRNLLSAAVVVLASPSILSAQSEATRSMKGATGVAVFVSAADAVKEAGYTESLFRASVEKQLRDAGIAVADTSSTDSSLVRLRIYVDMIPADPRNPGRYALSTRHSAQQLVAIRRDTTTRVHEAETWKSSTLSAFAAHEMEFAVTHTVLKQTATFILAYRSSNIVR
jgi:hypothetical protein